MHNRAIGFLILYGSAMLVAFVFPPAGVWGFLFESNYHPPFNRWWGRAIMSLGDRWSFYIGAVMVLAVLLNWSRYQAVPFWKHTQSKLLILFSINACVVTVFAYDMDASWNEMVDNLKWLLVYFCIIKTHSDRRWLPVILYIYIFAAIDAGWQTTFDPKSGRFVRGGPVTASVDENFVASHMIALLPMVAFYAFSPNIERWLRAICLLGAPLMLNVVAHAQSRGAFLALAAAGAVLPLVAKGRLRGIAIVVLLLGALASARLFHQQFWDRMGTIETYQEDGSAEGRIAAWKDAWDLSLQNPFGYGGEAFDRGLKRVSKTTHNMYFECLVAWGFQGTLIWLGFIGVTCWDCWRMIRKLYRPGEWPQSRAYIENVALLTGLVSMLVTAIFLNRMRWELWWVFAAIVVCQKNIATAEVSQIELSLDSEWTLQNGEEEISDASIVATEDLCVLNRHE